VPTNEELVIARAARRVAGTTHKEIA
jgi:hypothetical protein